MCRRIWCTLWALYAAAVFALSHRPIAGGALPFPHFDKWFHAGEFALFFALAWKATNRRPLLSLAVTAFYAGSDELHQAFVTTRTASVIDLAADLLGASLALLILQFGSRLWRFRRRRILDEAHSKEEL